MKITKTIEVDITPSEMAKIFASENELYQSEFLNELAAQVDTWDKPFCFQLQSITDCVILSDDARNIMKQIGEYSSKV